MKHRKSSVHNKKKEDAAWRRMRSALAKDSIRVTVPRAFLPALTHFFHHVVDAMAGDDRPDHGLAMMRRGRKIYSAPFYSLYWKLKQTEKKMGDAQRRKASQLFDRYLELERKVYENNEPTKGATKGTNGPIMPQQSRSKITEGVHD